MSGEVLYHGYPKKIEEIKDAMKRFGVTLAKRAAVKSAVNIEPYAFPYKGILSSMFSMPKADALRLLAERYPGKSPERYYRLRELVEDAFRKSGKGLLGEKMQLEHPLYFKHGREFPWRSGIPAEGVPVDLSLMEHATFSPGDSFDILRRFTQARYPGMGGRLPTHLYEESAAVKELERLAREADMSAEQLRTAPVEELAARMFPRETGNYIEGRLWTPAAVREGRAVRSAAYQQGFMEKLVKKGGMSSKPLSRAAQGLLLRVNAKGTPTYIGGGLVHSNLKAEHAITSKPLREDLVWTTTGKYFHPDDLQVGGKEGQLWGIQVPDQSGLSQTKQDHSVLSNSLKGLWHRIQNPGPKDIPAELEWHRKNLFKEHVNVPLNAPYVAGEVIVPKSKIKGAVPLTVTRRKLDSGESITLGHSGNKVYLYHGPRRPALFKQLKAEGYEFPQKFGSLAYRRGFMEELVKKAGAFEELKPLMELIGSRGRALRAGRSIPR